VSKVAKTLANALKFRTSCFTSTSDFDEEQKRLRLGAELLVTTPGRLLDLLKRKQVQLSDLQTIVLDEVDSLYLDKQQPLEPIAAAVPTSTQFLFTSATLPAEMVEKICKEFPEAVQLAGPGLHRVAPQVSETIIDCSGPRTQTKNFDQVGTMWTTAY
jgi:ATP-dependent RNA helicase DDX18/HAS1